MAGSVLGRVRVARFKWTGAHTCASSDVRGWGGGTGAEDGRNGPLPRARVAAMSLGEEGGGGGVERGRKGSTFVHVRLKFSVGFE